MSQHPAPSFLLASDVLIIGGGLAALVAALTAREHGCSVAVVSLGPVGGSGNTLVSRGNFASASREPGNDAALFLNDLSASAKGIADPALAARLAADSEAALLYLEKSGVPLLRDSKGFPRNRPPGHSVPRCVPTDKNGFPHAILGAAITKPLLARLKASGALALHGFRAVHLVRQENGIAGAIVHERKVITPRLIRSRRIILATGGYGGLFRRTNNVSDIYGDGIALALEAGCAVRDMEMVQFFPTMMYSPVKMTISGPLLGAGAVLRNRDGERFMQRYDPKGDMATRDSMARAIFCETTAGNGIDGCVSVDCTGIPGDVLRNQFASFCATLAKHGLDPAKDWLSVTPSTHYTLGGICIDDHGRTTVSGLYAAGEVTGGVHGADRLPGAGLMEAAVFGRQAGLAAATDSLQATSGAPDLRQFAGIPDEADRGSNLRSLRDLLWDHVSLARDAAGIKQAIAGIEILKEKEFARPGGRHSHFASNLLIGEAVAKSALTREESRGAHYRSDFPETNPAWAKPIYCALHNERLVLYSPTL